MNSQTSGRQQKKRIGRSRFVFRGLLRTLIYVLFAGAIFFLCAGRLNVAMAWVYFAIVLVNMSVTSLMMNPELIIERSRIKKDVKRWDILLAIVVGRIAPLAILTVAGLDVRFGWSPQISLAFRMGALGIAVLGVIVTDWAVISNKFFSAVIRIQKDRGHTVVSTGPYQYVRHPGYAGMIPSNLMIPVVLGSLWALIPAGLLVCLTIVRTIFEDRTLQEELDGYESYKKQVRYRLLPKIW